MSAPWAKRCGRSGFATEVEWDQFGEPTGARSVPCPGCPDCLPAPPVPEGGAPLTPEQRAAGAIRAWELSEGESMRDGHAETMRRIIADRIREAVEAERAKAEGLIELARAVAAQYEAETEAERVRCKALAAALSDLRTACTQAYKGGRIPAEPFVRAGNVLADYESSK